MKKSDFEQEVERMKLTHALAMEHTKLSHAQAMERSAADHQRHLEVVSQIGDQIRASITAQFGALMPLYEHLGPEATANQLRLQIEQGVAMVQRQADDEARAEASWLAWSTVLLGAAKATWRDLVLVDELRALPLRAGRWGEHHGDVDTRSRLERWDGACLEHPHARHDELDALRPRRAWSLDIPDIGGETW